MRSCNIPPAARFRNARPYEDDDFHIDEVERNLSGWFGWLDDDDPDTRQFAARQASTYLRQHGLAWGDVARIAAHLIMNRRQRAGR
jgi:hypothetical protein